MKELNQTVYLITSKVLHAIKHRRHPGPCYLIQKDF
jgi:hypothetical protein